MFLKSLSYLFLYFAISRRSVTGTSAISLGYDQVYDIPTGSLSTVACSTGSNGLQARFPTFSSLPGYPYIGAVSAITDWNSTNCGSCWEFTYTDVNRTVRTVSILAIDYADAPVSGGGGEPVSSLLESPLRTLKGNGNGHSRPSDQVIEVNIALAAMEDLTGGHAIELGVIDVEFLRLPAALCGL